MAEVKENKITKESELLIAAAEGDVDKIVSQLCLEEVDVNCTRPVFGTSPLALACRNGHAKTAQVLINAGADIKMEDSFGATPLHWAANSGHQKVIELLVKQYKDDKAQKLPPLPYNKSVTSFVQTADPKRGNAHPPTQQTIHSSLDKQALSSFLGKRDHYGSTPLHFAAVNNHLGAVATLIKLGADVTVTNSAAKTARELSTDPLVTTCLHGEEQKVRVQESRAAMAAATRARTPPKSPGQNKSTKSSRDSSPGKARAGVTARRGVDNQRRGNPTAPVRAGGASTKVALLKPKSNAKGANPK